jgi:hypothetical protein
MICAELTQKRKENDGCSEGLLDVGTLGVAAQVGGTLRLGQNDADDVDQEQQVDLKEQKFGLCNCCSIEFSVFWFQSQFHSILAFWLRSKQNEILELEQNQNFKLKNDESRTTLNEYFNSLLLDNMEFC